MRSTATRKSLMGSRRKSRNDDGELHNTMSSISSKPPRGPPTPSPTPGPHHGPKLPKFLQKSSTRDRSKSVIDPIMHSGTTSASASASADSSLASSSSLTSLKNSPSSQDSYASGSASRTRRVSRLKGTLKELKDDRIGQIRERDREQADDEPEDVVDDMPVIIEPTGSSPALGSRPRTRAERPLSASSSDSHPGVNYYHSAHSGHSQHKLSDMGTRLSGWFSHTFSTSSSTDLSLPAILANTTPMASSPTKKSGGGGLGIITVAKHGKGHLDKAMRYLLDSDASPDKCSDPIWLLGVQHPGYEPPPPPPTEPPSSGRRSSMDMRRSGSIRSSMSSIRNATSSPEPSMTHQQRNPGANWPPSFYADFTSRIWLTYRSHYPPIRDNSLAQLEGEACGQLGPQAMSASPRKWGFLSGGEKSWTSDSGWGCMLRTGQSLLANALVHLHLGRDWRRPPHPVYTADYADYIKILTWFFDSPDAHCPFSVHRMALAGKDMGTDVGQWFGPSIAAGAIKKLVDNFSEAGLGVSIAVDNAVYETDVLAASNSGPYMHAHSRNASVSPASRRRRSEHNNHSMMSIWGQRPVLILVGVRLGFDNVNPVYYEYVKELFTLPQSVGIAGGRPSSSYYFIGAQSDSLFYLDPHHSRPAVALRPPPPDLSRQSTRDTFNTSDPRSTRTPSSPADSPPSSYRDTHIMPMALSNAMNVRHARGASSTSSYRSQISPSPSVGSLSVSGQSMALDPLQEHYVTSYSPVELRTFHCDRVRKLPLSGLDPSMLLGFLCRDERDWLDLREKIAMLNKKYKPIFSIQDEPPSWPSDSDDGMGMESVSDIDIDTFSDPDEEPEEGNKDEFGMGHRPIVREDSAGRQSEEVTTEEDLADPVTPGLSPSRDFREQMEGGPKHEEEDLLGDDDDWVETDPCMPTPRPLQHPREAPNFPVLTAVPLSTVSSTSTDASYVSATSSYSDFPSKSPSPVLVSSSSESTRNGSPSIDIDKEMPEKVREKEIKGRRTPASPSAKIRSSKSGGRSKRETSTASAQDYVPFPVVDDREPDDESDLLSSEMRQQIDRPRTETGTSVNRTPIASVVMQRDANISTDTAASANLGYRVRNVFGRDGGRTQSGGVRGIVASEADEVA